MGGCVSQNSVTGRSLHAKKRRKALLGDEVSVTTLREESPHLIHNFCHQPCSGQVLRLYASKLVFETFLADFMVYMFSPLYGCAFHRFANGGVVILVCSYWLPAVQVGLFKRGHTCRELFIDYEHLRSLGAFQNSSQKNYVIWPSRVSGPLVTTK
jgi:hypothetical protein